MLTRSAWWLTCGWNPCTRTSGMLPAAPQSLPLPAPPLLPSLKASSLLELPGGPHLPTKDCTVMQMPGMWPAVQQSAIACLLPASQAQKKCSYPKCLNNSEAPFRLVWCTVLFWVNMLVHYHYATQTPGWALETSVYSLPCGCSSAVQCNAWHSGGGVSMSES